MTLYFYGGDSPFSNFYPVNITYNSKEYSTTEHLFQSMKFENEQYSELIRIADTPAKAAALARQKKNTRHDRWYVNKNLYPNLFINDVIDWSIQHGIRIRSDWDTYRNEVMWLALKIKFSIPQFKQYLLDTGNVVIYEDSPTDYYWGIGEKKNGQNMLGKMLVHLRNLIRPSYPIVGFKYEKGGIDFEYLMRCKIFENALFIFNDNQVEHNSCKKGHGNAEIRQYNKYSSGPIKSAGIPTGKYRNGYSCLAEGKDDIDKSIDEIKELLSSGRYDSIVYSVQNIGNATIGTSIFELDDELKEYITNKILELSNGGWYYFYSYSTGISAPIY